MLYDNMCYYIVLYVITYGNLYYVILACTIVGMIYIYIYIYIYTHMHIYIYIYIYSHLCHALPTR